jgi:hypothetical protein
VSKAPGLFAILSAELQVRLSFGRIAARHPVRSGNENIRVSPTMQAQQRHVCRTAVALPPSRLLKKHDFSLKGAAHRFAASGLLIDSVLDQSSGLLSGSPA